MSNKRKIKLTKAVAWLILGLSVCVMMICGYKLWEIQQSYRAGDVSYRELAVLARPAKLTVSAEAAKIDEDTPSIDFAALRAINPDTAAWLYCPDTVIDYPVMRALDYNSYLRRLPDGTFNANGALFIDYNCSPDFSDKLTVIYGHNMRSGRMFGSLVNYKKQSYFEQNPCMFLYTESCDYRIDLVYGCVIGAREWRERAFMYENNADALMTYAAYNTTFASEAQYTPEDMIIVLSTCSYEFDDARYVVIGLLRSPHRGDRAETGELVSAPR